jgi:C4-dicarboxylate transporter DctQ subunit
MKIIEKVSYWLDYVTRLFIATFLGVMTIALTAQIIARSIFQGGFVWTDELSRFLMVALIFLGAASATRDNTHITVSILEDWKPSLKKWLAPIQWLAMFIYAVILVIVGFDTLQIVGPQQSVNMQISMGIVYSVFPVSALIMIVHLLTKIKKAKETREEHGL